LAVPQGRGVRNYDAVVIGGGHNGLTCAAYLARAGLSVVVLERRHILGGATVTEELWPGFKISVASYVVSLLRPEIIRELELARHGLQILPVDGTLTPTGTREGDYLWRVDDHGTTRRELRRHSKRDAEAYEEYSLLMAEMARFVKPLLGSAAPRLGTLDARGLAELAGLARRFGALPESQQTTFIALLTMSSADFVSQWFETEPLKATLSASGIIGTFLGPRSPGTAYVLLHHYLGEIDGEFRAWGLPRGGTGAVSGAIAAAAQEAGAELRTEAAVERITTRGGRATGVVLESGEEINASAVISSADVRVTLGRLVESGALPPESEDAVRRYKFRGSSGKVNFALDRLPTFSNVSADRSADVYRGMVSISPSVDYLERAYDDAVAGRFSREPYVDIGFPSAVDPSVAPPGKHVMACFVQYAPYALADSDWDTEREAFGDTVQATIAKYAPDLPDVILHRQVLTPLDIERTFSLSEGNIMQGELLLEQLFAERPGVGLGYQTPIRDLWLCGASTHPGGVITGAPGRNAAMAVLRGLRKGARAGQEHAA
jgi:phytoene dehydrogenase-like protein